MPPKKWEDEESSSEESSSSGSEVQEKVVAPATRRNKFDDEEESDDDVLDSWDAAEDSEVEREKAKKASEAKAKADAEAAANKKSRTARMAERISERKAQREAEDSNSDSDSDETAQAKRERLRRAQKDADMKHAEDLFGDIGGITSRKGLAAAVVVVDPSKPNQTVDLGDIPLFRPRNKSQLEHLGTTMAPLLGQYHKMQGYTAFFQALVKAMAKEMPSDQVKKVASTLTAVSNEKMRTEKATQQGKKKGGAKAKTTLVSARNNISEDKEVYDKGGETFGDDDFM